MLGRDLQNQTPALLVLFMWLVKSFKNFRFLDHLEKYDLLSDFQYGFRPTYLLTVSYDRIVQTYNRPKATGAVTRDISRVFDRASHVGLLHKLKPDGILGQPIGFVLSFHSDERFQTVLDGNSQQEKPFILVFFRFQLFLQTSCYTLMTFLIILWAKSVIYVDDTVVYSKYDQLFDLVELGPERPQIGTGSDL